MNKEEILNSIKHVGTRHNVEVVADFLEREWNATGGGIDLQFSFDKIFEKLKGVLSEVRFYALNLPPICQIEFSTVLDVLYADGLDGSCIFSAFENNKVYSYILVRKISKGE